MENHNDVQVLTKLLLMFVITIQFTVNH